MKSSFINYHNLYTYIYNEQYRDAKISYRKLPLISEMIISFPNPTKLKSKLTERMT